MSDKKISQLPTISNLSSNSVFAVVSTGVTYQTSLATLGYFLSTGGNISINNVVYTTGNQTISGVKTFVHNVTLGGDVNISSGLQVQGLLIANGHFYATSSSAFDGTATFNDAVNALLVNTNTLEVSGNSTLNGNLNAFSQIRPYGGISGYLRSGEGGGSGSVANAVYTTGNQTISGNKNFIGDTTNNNLSVTGQLISNLLIDNEANNNINLLSGYLNGPSLTVNFSDSVTTLYGDWKLNGYPIVDSNYLVTGQNVCIFKTPKINFKTTGTYSIYTIPSNLLFLIESMEIITTNITGSNQAPYVKFGNNSNSEAYQTGIQTQSNSLYSRHVFDKPQDAVGSNITLNATISTASTATTHSGVLIYKGYLIPNI